MTPPITSHQMMPIPASRVLPAFLLASTPVTNEQYRVFTMATGHERPFSWRDRNFNADDQPVVCVSWDDAMAYCKWAGMRLPTSEEWRHACLAGATTRYWSGDTEEDLERVAWFNKNSEGRLRVVAQKPTNLWGLHDMHGNVWEWCSTEFSYEPPYRYILGGSWRNSALACHSGNRLGASVRYTDNDVGFRPAKDMP